ncbi:hypothetical protein ACLI4Q_05605 [Natrialbaceae archaeon A-CW1-1]
MSRLIEETPGWALVGMGLLFLFFGDLLDQQNLVREIGGLLVAVIIVNILYNHHFMGIDSNKTLMQALLLFSALGGLLASRMIEQTITVAVGDIRVVQILGLILIVSRLGVDLPRLNVRHDKPLPSLGGQITSYAMYTAGIVAFVAPELFEYLWLGQYYGWMNWFSLILACLSFGAVYVFRT